ncbi:hypothetical protein ACNH6C_13755 [Bdellovibrio bacteriovorus]|uniref:hypothetical protein n=1 Tax=Bdellovibrio bacteriovorus TaxID=959 RepID=UPI003A8082B4
MVFWDNLAKIGLFCFIFMSLGCATVILDNDAVLEPPKSDPVRFDDPVCIHLNFKTNNVGFFNEPEGEQPMEELQLIMSSVGLTYYNIIQKCKTPVATYTVIVSSKTRNWWARSMWALTSYLTIGIVPFYVEETGVVSIVGSDGKVIVEAPYEEKRLTSIFAVPKWIIDFKKSVDQYSTNPDISTTSRREAILIKKAFEQRNVGSVP